MKDARPVMVGRPARRENRAWPYSYRPDRTGKPRAGLLCRLALPGAGNPRGSGRTAGQYGGRRCGPGKYRGRGRSRGRAPAGHLVGGVAPPYPLPEAGQAARQQQE
ncbi:hypothetical protein [Hymenobacter mucosus]|uniref:hypothetical protein n=1 Tax=Hymenobacter mucosus TaxID=1411120 RepID=UPI00117BA9BE|nr:hypothetical protein [Hymenobacter mucosus]